MPSWLLFGASCLLSLWATAKCLDIPPGMLVTECRDRYFIIVVDLSFLGDEPRFEAVDATGAYPITEWYSAECGYNLNVLLSGHAQLRASYFSCHTDNVNDTSFTFQFNVITTSNVGNEANYTLNNTCSPLLPFSPREVTCEINYMEVSVQSDMPLPSGTTRNDWDAGFSTAHDRATSDWLVMFQREGLRLPPMTLSKARTLGYVFDVTDGRLVFRTPYGQPHSFTNEVDGVLVESVHPTLFSRRRWLVLMVDLVAACSISDQSYSHDWLTWQTPHPVPDLENVVVSMGVNGQLLEQPLVEARGYIVNMSSTAVQISIPYNAEGWYRQRFVMENVYNEFSVFFLYFEQLFMDNRQRFFRPLATPLLSRLPFTINQTVVEQHVFTVYVGDFQSDVELVTVRLNGQDFALPLANMGSLTVSRLPQGNVSHGYVLRVPFEDPVVLMRLHEGGILQYMLNITFTLNLQPENDYFNHLSSIMAEMTDVFPPALEGVCGETGITFTLTHQPFHYLWTVSIGTHVLTPALASGQGYSLSNDSQSLQLEVPFHSPGYTYTKIELGTTTASFEFLIRNARTLNVEASSSKTCSFPTTEVIGCSAGGVMTVVANVSRSIPGVNPSRTSLISPACGPMNADNSRAMFSFALSTCGTTVTIGMHHVTYENRIIQRSSSMARTTRGMITVQCVYPLVALHRLFSSRRFESDYPGLGSMVHTALPAQPPRLLIDAVTAAPTTLRTTTHHWFRFLKETRTVGGS